MVHSEPERGLKPRIDACGRTMTLLGLEQISAMDQLNTMHHLLRDMVRWVICHHHHHMCQARLLEKKWSKVENTVIQFVSWSVKSPKFTWFGRYSGIFSLMMASDNSRPMYSASPGYEAVMAAVPGCCWLAEDGADGYMDCEDG